MAWQFQWSRSKTLLLTLALGLSLIAPASGQENTPEPPLTPPIEFEAPPGAEDLPPLPMNKEPRPAERVKAGEIAQAAAAGAALDDVRVVDMKVLFETHAGFDAGMKSLKAEFEAAAERVKKDREAITKLDEELKDLRDGTPEYRKLSLEISRRKADWKVEAEKQLNEFKDREVKLLWDTYNDIQDAIRAHCEAKGVTLVLQYRSEAADGKTKKSITEAIGRQIVYVQPSRDITPFIKEVVNKRVAQAAGQDPR